jgi:hypothetical protein
MLYTYLRVLNLQIMDIAHNNLLDIFLLILIIQRLLLLIRDGQSIHGYLYRFDVP